MFKQNQIIQNVKASELSYEAYGTVRLENYSIFVENFLPGEIADVVLIKVNAKFAYAKVLNLKQKSNLRIEPKNAKLLASGAAPLSILSYEEQLKFKQKIVSDLFKRNLNFEKVLPILESDKEWNYRNKLTVFIKKINNHLKLGLFAKNSNLLIEQNSYDLAANEINKFILFLENEINQYSCFIDNYEKIQSFTIRFSEAYKSLMLIINSKKHFKLDQIFINSIQNEFNNLTSIVQLFTSKGKEEIEAYTNKTSIKDKINDLEFKINCNSFFQVNSSQTFNLYSLLVESLDLSNQKNVLDAYCGIGTISLFLAQKSKKVFGLEIVSDAIENAKENAIINNIKNVEFISGDVDETINFVKEKINILVVDPPREGLKNSFAEKILKIQPEQIGYISCNPRSLCRDAKLLINSGLYELNYLQPCDMFPQTYHIECVAIFKKIHH